MMFKVSDVGSKSMGRHDLLNKLFIKFVENKGWEVTENN